MPHGRRAGLRQRRLPLSHAVLGGLPIHKSGGCIVCHVTAEQVPAVADALEPLDGEWLRERYATLTFDAYQGTADAEDIAYTQAFRPGLKQFHGAAAREGRAVIFTVGQ